MIGRMTLQPKFVRCARIVGQRQQGRHARGAGEVHVVQLHQSSLSTQQFAWVRSVAVAPCSQGSAQEQEEEH